MTTWITQRQAAEMLGVGQAAVPKTVRAGKLHPRSRENNQPTLDLVEVEALRDAREAAVRARAERLAAEVSKQRTPPDDEHVWLSPLEAAHLLGITRQAVNARARKDQLPSVKKGDRRWIRRDQLAMVKKAHAVRDGVEAPDWVWSW